MDYQNNRAGLVFKYESVTLSRLHPPEPTSLRDLLADKGVPPLGDRFKLALNLATSLSVLHTSGWLHKQYNSHNILIFGHPPSSDSTTWRLGQAYVLGFDFSRPNEMEAVSDYAENNAALNLYRHPEGHGSARKRFCRAFDIYSLGIMLVELGYWRPISEFWRNSYDAHTFRNDLWTFHAPRLAAKTGLIYAGVVERCIGELANPDLDDGESQRNFFWMVVNELSRLSA
jgi:hypothetical protein